MKYNKAIAATTLTAASSLITVLTYVVPSLPQSIGGPIAAVLAAATPIVVYLVPNIDTIAHDVDNIVYDIHNHDSVQAAVDGAIVGAEAKNILDAAKPKTN